MHDFVTDGLYLLTLNLAQQYSYVGIRNCFYQVARIFLSEWAGGACGLLSAAHKQIHCMAADF